MKPYKPAPKGNGFNVRLGADLDANLSRLAKAAGVTKGECLRRLIQTATPDIFALGLKLAIEQKENGV